MTSSWLNWWFEDGKILKILILENFGKIRQTLFKMPRCQTRCPDVKQDARCQTRCPGKRNAQMSNEMPRKTRCPDAQANEMPRCPVNYPYVTRDAHMSQEIPRCQKRRPYVTRDNPMSQEMPRCQISLGLGRCASGPIESGHLGRCASGPIESGQMCIWAYWVWVDVHLGLLSSFFS